MSGVTLTLRTLHDDERDLEQDLPAAAERHRAEHEFHWEMLAQAAQATRDRELLELVSSCHPQPLRRMHWTNTMIKVLSPQLLVSA
ncbi:MULTISPECIES: hypothetical protein [unclassified Streptomyces]|uniref:hypothetical protein n=1 Tax=unclassified Streptomyces TaxID=2593676 RepID=UPI0020B8DC3A|nr:hypothetical protein [Streptomyces sp. AC558_RSS880]